MFATSGDALNVSLAIAVIILTIFLAILIFYGILILRDVSKTTERLQDITDKAHKTVTAPLRLIDFLMEKAEPYLEAMVDKLGKKKD